MRILFVNQFFWPELAATSVLLTDFARFLTEQGHEVSVMCGRTSYAGADATVRPDVDILTLPSASFGKMPGARIASYATFLAGALFRSVFIQKPDVVITMTTPPLTSLVGALMKTIRGVKHYIWEMDMYPDVAVDLGVVSANSLFAKWVGKFADWGRTHSDRVIALGDDMRNRLIARGVPAEKIRIAGNWADGGLFSPAPKAQDSAPLLVAYTGNLGMGHDVETISKTILGLRDNKSIRFIFVGGGERMKSLQSLCESERVPNAQFISYVTRERLNQIVADADIGLVTQNPSCVGSIVPSKFYSLAAASLPILYVGAPNATPATLIDQYQCGWFVRAGNAQRLQNLLIGLSNDRASVRQAGASALAAFRELWDRPIAVHHLAEMLDMSAKASEATAPQSNPVSLATE